MRPTLYLAGAGSAGLQRQAQRLVQSLGLQDQVVFLGKVADVPLRLARMQVFVLATHWEGMPLALVEAMAAGCACITSDAPGAREVLHHQHDGLIVPHADPDALAHALAQLLTRPDHAAQLGAQARRTALTRYGREQMGLRYQALLEAPLLNNTGS